MPDKEWDEEWGLSSGLPLDDADVTVQDVKFGFNVQISATAICANFTFLNEETGETSEQSFSCGDGWETAEKGAAIGTVDGKPRKLSNRSNYGRLVASALDVVGGPGNMPGRGFKYADTWIGTRWHLGTVKIESTNPQTQVTKTKDAIVFTAFLGAVEDEAPAKSGGAKKAAGTTKAAAKPAVAVAAGVDDDLFAELVEMAKAMIADGKDHDDFMSDALDREDVKGIKPVEKVVMSTKDGSVWKTAGGE